GPTFFMNLNQIDRQINDWFGANLSTEEIKLFKEINEALSKAVFVHQMDNFELNSQLRSKMSALTELIQKEVEKGQKSPPEITKIE
ncbi:MAG: hypothetical protein AAF840_09520, partial [Bacteroidota bacterium]